MAKDDFAIGLLQGLYQGGVGNPEVGEQRRQRQLEEAATNAQMAEQGYTPVDINKIPGFKERLISVLFPGQGRPVQYAQDPNVPRAYVSPTGDISQTPIPGAARLNPRDTASLYTSLATSKAESQADQKSKLIDSADALRKEFINRPEVREYVTVNTQVRSMDSMLKNALQGNLKNQLALDQALITMYNKLTDPNSVVRESEYARTPENLPMVNRIFGGIEKLKQGGAGLTNEDRKALVLGAKIIGNERGAEAMRARNYYEGVAQNRGADPSLVSGAIPAFQPYKIESLQGMGGKVRVTNGIMTYEIDANDLKDAQKDGFRLLQ